MIKSAVLNERYKTLKNDITETLTNLLPKTKLKVYLDAFKVGEEFDENDVILELQEIDGFTSLPNFWFNDNHGVECYGALISISLEDGLEVYDLENCELQFISVSDLQFDSEKIDLIAYLETK